MNHDYAHCLDYKKGCPRRCFRAKLVRDLKKRMDLIGIPVNWAHLRGSDLCPLTMK